MKIKRVAVVASIAAVLAAGCSDSGQEAEADGSQAHTPAGYHHVAVEAASVTFAAPEGWLDLAPEELDDHAASALVTLAEAAGVSEGELHSNAQELDLFIVEPAPADPSAPESISVTHEPGEVVGGLPTEQEVGALFESVGADIRGFETVAAPAGEVVYGVSEMSGARANPHMAMAFAFNDDGDLVVITIGADDAERLADVTHTLATTIAPA